MRVEDDAGNQSAATTFTVTPDAMPPGVALAPIGGAPVRGTIDLRATASDAGAGVQRVVFRRCRNGACTEIGTDSTRNANGAFTVSWNTTTAADGVDTIQVQAVDWVANTATETASVAVRNGS